MKCKSRRSGGGDSCGGGEESSSIGELDGRWRLIRDERRRDGRVATSEDRGVGGGRARGTGEVARRSAEGGTADRW